MLSKLFDPDLGLRARSQGGELEKGIVTELPAVAKTLRFMAILKEALEAAAKKA